MSATPSSTAVRPTARQLEYQDWEFGMFLHFGLRTFYEGWRDMDPRPMDPANFSPSDLSCDHWVETAKAAGMKYLVLTAKHHCGFANWPSKTTDFSVASSPWRGGHGDVIAEYLDACRRHGMAAGLYYSPYDHTCPVYDDPKAYDDYFINQISELLVPYGPIDVLWFDGCGSANHQYDWPRIVAEIRRMQPNVLLFSMGDPDIRWVGNECGIAPLPCWNVVEQCNEVQPADPSWFGDGRWLPAECDVRMRETNWFYSDQDEHTVKSLDELMGLYYYSVGRGANLLLNFGPDRRGRLPEHDAQRLLDFGAEIRRRFGSPLARLADCTREGNAWTWSPGEATLVDHVVAQEDLTGGERVRRFAIKMTPTHYNIAITLYEGQSLGHKAICRFPAVKARKVWLEVLEADGEPQLRALDFCYAGA